MTEKHEREALLEILRQAHQEKQKVEIGNQWQLVESLNDHPMWVECLADLVKTTESKTVELDVKQVAQ
jgi:protoheme ferro-lyase